MDESFRHVVDWGLEFMLDSNQYGADTVPYGYGRHCSPRTFGLGGSQCCTGFADTSTDWRLPSPSTDIPVRGRTSVDSGVP